MSYQRHYSVRYLRAGHLTLMYYMQPASIGYIVMTVAPPGVLNKT